MIAIITPDTPAAEADNNLLDDLDSIKTANDNHTENTFSDINGNSLELMNLIAITEESCTSQSSVVE